MFGNRVHFSSAFDVAIFARRRNVFLLAEDLIDNSFADDKLVLLVFDSVKLAIILIRGNHEDLFERFVTVDNGRSYSVHISNGTYDTALQLTGYDRVMSQLKHYDFAEAAQETPFYKTIMPAMRDYYETEHYVFVHGWIPCANDNKKYEPILDWRNATKEMWERARWYNGMDAAQNKAEQKTIVCGHWHASYGHATYEKKGSEFGPDADFSPYYGPGIIALDACTAYTGIANCIVIDD